MYIQRKNDIYENVVKYLYIIHEVLFAISRNKFPINKLVGSSYTKTHAFIIFIWFLTLGVLFLLKLHKSKGVKFVMDQPVKELVGTNGKVWKWTFTALLFT